MFQCFDCGKTFKEAAHLGVHSMKHLREKRGTEETIDVQKLAQRILTLLEDRGRGVSAKDIKKPPLISSHSQRIENTKPTLKAKFIRSFSAPLNIPPPPRYPPPSRLQDRKQRSYRRMKVSRSSS